MRGKIMIAVIPLRSGSKRLKDKNIIPFFGSLIFEHVLEMACNSTLFDKIIIAVDEEYKELMNKGDYEEWDDAVSIYIRQKQNSADASPLIDLVREVVDAYKITDNEMCILYSTSVLTTAEQLNDGAYRLHKGDVDCVFPIIKVKDELFIDENKVYRCCDIKEYAPYHIDSVASHADAWFMFNVNKVLETNKIIQDENGYIELKDYEAQGVHTSDDIDDLKYKYTAMKGNGR
jgi:pseudaminic acid cytidylyltransferase